MSEENNIRTDGMQVRHRHSGLQPFRDEGRMRNVRQWLNVVFMLGVVAGIIIYYTVSKDTATYILICACVFKFVELTLRIAKL